jgi:uncharacterized protein YkwD
MVSIRFLSALRRVRLRFEEFEPRALLSNGVQPSAVEQIFLERLNDARANPAAYGSSIGVDLSNVSPAPPLAFDTRLVDAARQHSQDMNDRNYFDHNTPEGLTPGDRITNAGFSWSSCGESIAAGYSTPEAALAALIKDANDLSLEHRRQLLAIDEVYKGQDQVGIGIVQGGTGTYSNYYTIDTASTSDTRPFLTGVVFADANGNGRYDAGEGVGGVTITVGGVGSTITFTSGGYSLQVNPGVYTVTAGGGGLATPRTQTVVVGATNYRLNVNLGNFVGTGSRLFAIGGAPGRVQLRRDSDGSLVTDFAPYGPGYTGPISVAVGDVTGNGFLDLVTGAEAGNPDVRVYDGRAIANGTFNPNKPDASLLVEWFPYPLQFNVGANVAVGDVNGDGFADIVTGATSGNPDVRVYYGQDIAKGTFKPNGSSLLAQWFPYALQFNVGANVAVGDVNGDGFADIVTGATAGNPDVRVYNGQDIAKGTFNPDGSSLLAQWFAYDLNFNVGVFVAVGDSNGDRYGDVITGASAGNPQVKVFAGQAVATGTIDPANPEASLVTQFFAYDLQLNIGTAVAAADFEGNGQFQILTGASSGSPHYRVVAANATGTNPPALVEDIASDIQGGLLVGA